MKPLVKWSGGKTDEIDEIMKHVPETIDTYLEPFAGGAALLFHLAPQKAVINDIHPDLINFYTEIKNGNGPEIHKMMEQIENTEDEYYTIRDTFIPSTNLEKAFQFYYLRKTCYRGMLRYNKSGKFNIPWGRYKTVTSTDVANPEYRDLLGRTTIMCGDFEEVFKRYNDHRNFCFIDQPYDSQFTDYGYCKFEHAEQERLARVFKETKNRCLMIVGDTEYIRGLYDGYVVGSYPKKYRFKLHSGRIGDEINTRHLIIKNF